MKKAISLHNGETVEGEALIAKEADFIAQTWSFEIDDQTRVGAGEFIIISSVDLQAAAARAAAKDRPSECQHDWRSNACYLCGKNRPVDLGDAPTINQIIAAKRRKRLEGESE